MNLEKLGSLKVRRKMYAWAVEDCDVWMNEIMRMGGNPAILKSHKKKYMKTLKKIDDEISHIRNSIESLEDKTVSQILIMRFDEGMKIKRDSSKDVLFKSMDSRTDKKRNISIKLRVELKNQFLSFTS